jgi:hypothetical protein
VVGRRLRGTVVDGVGPIARIEAAAVVKDRWIPFFPTDGVFDEPREDFDADVTSLVEGGETLVVLRVFDRAGNVALRNVAVK